MRKNCETCKHDRLKTSICDECYNTSDAPTKWEPAGHYKPDTNADRIRAMSDEELANYLLQFGDLEDRIKFCQNLPECDALLNTEEGIPEEKCVGCLLKWLRKPVEEKK